MDIGELLWYTVFQIFIRMRKAMIIETMVLTPLKTRCYILKDEDSGECIVIDPASSGEKIYEKITSEGYKIKKILLTHGHFDHIGGADALSKLTGLPITATEHDNLLRADPTQNASRSMFKNFEISSHAVSENIKEGDIITCGGISLTVYETPGHTQGSVTYVTDGCAFTGDTVFENGYGRTDLPTGDIGQLRQTVKKLKIILKDKKIYPGH